MKSSKYLLIVLTAALLFGCNTDPWISLFDGESLEGWKASENTGSWKVEEGAIVTSGERSHLFYDGQALKHEPQNRDRLQHRQEDKHDPALRVRLRNEGRVKHDTAPGGQE